ncbi:hypothetical protein J4446_00260 [Candidatus Woesearchaeota archaeon]|nr:hypothetical protein [Candidatus Woesearchaeota archaeon]
MNKKGEWGWEEISKILIVLIVIIILIGIIVYLKGRGSELVQKIIEIFRFS